MEWPLRNEETGKPSTTPTNQAIFKAAIQPAIQEHPESVRAWEAKLEASTPNWRQDYAGVIQEFVKIQAACSPSVVVEMCEAGLQAANQAFRFRIQSTSDTTAEDTGTVSIEQAFQEQRASESDEANLKSLVYMGGTKASSDHDTDSEHGTVYRFPLASPHGSDDTPLWITGDDAVAQLEAWKSYGCMEPSAAEHAQSIVQAQDPSLYCRDKIFVLLGVTSEMGPTRHLLKIPGTHVVGVARSGPKTNDLVEWFQKHGSPTSKLTLIDQGADMLQSGPQIARWIVHVLKQQSQEETKNVDNTIVLMPLAYMDGEANCRVTVAMDAITTHIMGCFPQKVQLGYLTSPTTVYTIPPEAAMDAKERYENIQSSFFTRFISLASFGAWLKPSNTWTQLEPQQQQEETQQSSSPKQLPILCDGIMTLQGPNYLLAKTMQQWRCMVAHAQGVVVAAPHAPGTRTFSVQKNANAAAGLEGLQYIAPMVAFDVQPCSSLMTAIVLHQLGESGSKATKTYQHPMELFWDGAVHGGGWRCPFDPASCAIAGFLLGKTIAKAGWCPSGALAPVAGNAEGIVRS